MFCYCYCFNPKLHVFVSLVSWWFTGKSPKAWILPVPKVSPAISPKPSHRFLFGLHPVNNKESESESEKDDWYKVRMPWPSREGSWTPWAGGGTCIGFIFLEELTYLSPPSLTLRSTHLPFTQWQFQCGGSWGSIWSQSGLLRPRVNSLFLSVGQNEGCLVSRWTK